MELFRLFTSGSKSGRLLDLDLDLVHCFMQQSGLVQRNRDCALVAFWCCVAAARHWNAEQRQGQHIQPFVSTFLHCAAECVRQRICPIFSAFPIRCIYVSCFFIDTDKIITDKDYSYVTLIAFTEREGERISDHCVYCLSADLVTVNHSRSRPRTHATEQRKHLK